MLGTLAYNTITTLRCQSLCMQRQQSPMYRARRANRTVTITNLEFTFYSFIKQAKQSTSTFATVGTVFFVKLSVLFIHQERKENLGSNSTTKFCRLNESQNKQIIVKFCFLTRAILTDYLLFLSCVTKKNHNC